MKNKKYWVIFSLVVLLTFGFNIQEVKADLDQKCDDDTSNYDGYKNIADDSLAQTFKPSLNRLQIISMDVKGDGEEGDSEMGILLYKEDTLVASSISNMEEPSGLGLINFSFSSIEVVPGDTYMIKPYISGNGNNFLGWWYEEDCYSDGKARVDSVSQSYDFGFATGGYHFVEEEEEEPEPADDPTPPDPEPVTPDPPLDDPTPPDSPPTPSDPDPEDIDGDEDEEEDEDEEDDDDDKNNDDNDDSNSSSNGSENSTTADLDAFSPGTTVTDSSNLDTVDNNQAGDFELEDEDMELGEETLTDLEKNKNLIKRDTNSVVSPNLKSQETSLAKKIIIALVILISAIPLGYLVYYKFLSKDKSLPAGSKKRLILLVLIILVFMMIIAVVFALASLDKY